MTNPQKTLDELREARARTYLFFGGFFDQNRKNDSLSLLNAVMQLTEEEAKEVGLAWEKPADLPANINTQQLEVEFSKLFYGVGKETIPLSESAHFDEHHLLCQKAYASVKNIYRAKGFSVEDSYEMQADSISVELAFVSLLVEQKAVAGEVANFLNEHLIPLANIVCQSILTKTDNQVLLTVAKTLPTYLQAEKKLLELCKN